MRLTRELSGPMIMEMNTSAAVPATLQCRNAILIYNPEARRLSRNPKDLKRRIQDKLSKYGLTIDFWATERSHHATQLAREALETGTDLIIAAGGDGTVNEVIAGMAGSRVPLLVLPGGTANVLAKEIGLPSGVTQSLDLVRTGVVRRIALGKAGTRHFVLMAGIGVDASIVKAVQPRLKRWLGQGAFWLAGFRQFFSYRFPPFELVIGGIAYTGSFAVIGRAKSYGGPFSIVSQANLFSDRFDVCLYQSTNRWRYLSYLFFTTFGRHSALADVQSLKAEMVEARGDSEVWFQVDGELVGRIPQKFTVERDALSLVIPRRTASGLPLE